ncbi:hypothetical protein Moror_7079 [Moniliophthora roreri MCA 2997]|uniref:Uncharacterized protein n=1 Tax=Moniliophthora roreri (strain MCA 2997) TaxID=1381753 RepID=V2XAT2_MONRO|nr:hypothetical protein Moror_7079 [Moniliophthora roreri MCA 2997]
MKEAICEGFSSRLQPSTLWAITTQRLHRLSWNLVLHAYASFLGLDLPCSGPRGYSIESIVLRLLQSYDIYMTRVVADDHDRSFAKFFALLSMEDRRDWLFLSA